MQRCHHQAQHTACNIAILCVLKTTNTYHICTLTCLHVQGLFVASAETSQPGKLLHELQQILQTITEVAPTDLDVSEAKNEVLNSFVFNFSSKSQQLQRCLVYELLGLPQVGAPDIVRSHLGHMFIILHVTTRDVLQVYMFQLHYACSCCVVC